MKPVITATAFDVDLMSFDDGWQPLTADGVTQVWSILSATFGPRLSTPEKVRLAEQEPSFLHHGKILRIRGRRGLGQTTRYAMLFSDGTCLAIRYSARLIEELASRDRLHLTPDTLADYIEFYWRFTEHGRRNRQIDGDRPLAVEAAANGAWSVTGIWHEDGRAMPLNALVHGNGQISFASDASAGSVTSQ